MSGALTADVDLHARAAAEGGGLVGHVRFDLSEGSFSGAGLPMAVPFERLTGDLQFGDGSFVRVEGAKLEGPVLVATVEGNIGDAPERGAQPLDLRLSYELRDKSLVRMFGEARGGGAISGTLREPVLE